MAVTVRVGCREECGCHDDDECCLLGEEEVRDEGQQEPSISSQGKKIKGRAVSSEFRNRFRGWGEGAQACHADLCTNERNANNSPRKRTTRRLFGRQTLSQPKETPVDRGRGARGEIDLDKTHECPAPLLRLAVV